MNTLEPSRVWQYFDEILKIPRLSKKEEKMVVYLEAFAKKHQLPFKKDSLGNCLIKKPASAGHENKPTVILQSHIDMVGEKLLDVEHDFNTDPITSVVKDGWVTAEGTTLGADDGIGIAASLAILESKEFEHGPLECLFTVDEETGMTGAFGLEEGFMEGKILLNLDSEDEGEIFIGCAGGIDTIARFRKETIEAKEYTAAMKVSVEGLQGGHSGDEIHKGFGNAIKVIVRLLWRLSNQYPVGISALQGGKLRNAIPRESSSLLVYKKEDREEIIEYLHLFEKMIAAELAPVEPDFRMRFVDCEIPQEQFHPDFQQRLIRTLYACPHGVIDWSKEIPGLVETSTNLAVIDDSKEDYIEIITSQRSSRDTAKKCISERIEALFLLGSAEVRHSDGYPGWDPNPDSAVLKVSEEVYEKLFNEKPQVKAIHAGLECGLFLTKYPYLDMISFGPTIKGAHTPDERIHIGSVKKFWDFLLELLKSIS